MVKDYTDYIVCGTIMLQIRNMSCSDDHNIDMFDCSTMSTTEGGRKVTAAVASAGRAVASTSTSRARASARYKSSEVSLLNSEFVIVSVPRYSCISCIVRAV